MLDLHGDVTSVCLFVRAVAFTSSTISSKTIDAEINEVSRTFNNFDIPRGLVREGTNSKDYHLNFTQLPIINFDYQNKYYSW